MTSLTYHTHTHQIPYQHSLSQPFSHTKTAYSLSHLSHICIHTHSHTLTLTFILSHTHTQTQTHTHSHSLSLTHTHTHTHTHRCQKSHSGRSLSFHFWPA